MDKQKAKRIIPKIIFILSFVPIIIILITAVYVAFAGYMYSNWKGIGVGPLYGWEAFESCFTRTSLGWCIIPVLPIMAIYQLVFIIVSIAKRLKIKRH